MLQSDEADDYVVATGQTNSLQDFTAAAFDAVGLDWRDHVDSDSTLFRRTDIACSRANPDKAASNLGWRAASKMTDVVRRMVQELSAPRA